MSVVTADPIFGNRSRISSMKHGSRHYTRVSQSNLDKKTIIAYLRAHHMNKTLACFLAEDGKVGCLPLLQTFSQSASLCQSQPNELIQQIKQRARLEVKAQTLLKMELFVHIWYCLGDKVLLKDRIQLLKSFLEQKGPVLAQVPQLLAYFALPYSDNPSSHPFLSRLFCQEWRQGLQQLIGEIVGVEQGQDQQWLNIIGDLIDINNSFRSRVNMEQHQELQTLVERVKMYQKVIENNKHQNKSARNKSISEQHSGKKESDAIEEKLERLRSDFGTGRLGSYIQMARIYHSTQVRLAELAAIGQDRSFLADIIKSDVLALSEGGEWDCERLRLLQMVSSYFLGRTYIGQHPAILPHLASMLTMTQLQPLLPSKLNMLYSCLDILQKCMVRQQLFSVVPLTTSLLQWLLTLLQTQQRAYRSNPEISRVYTASIALIINLTMHRAGRQCLAKTNLLTILTDILRNMPDKHDNLLLQQMICSTIYLLLADEGQREIAGRVRLKDILLDRMIAKQNGTFDNIVQYTIERLETEGQISEPDSDQDQQQQEQYDQNIQPSKQFIYVREERIPLHSLPPPKQHQSHQQQSKYSKDRYNWKSKYDRFKV